MKKLLLFFVFFISLNTLAGPKVFRTNEGMLYVENVKSNKKEENIHIILRMMIEKKEHIKMVKKKEHIKNIMKMVN